MEVISFPMHCRRRSTPTRSVQRFRLAVEHVAPLALASLNRGRIALPPQGRGGVCHGLRASITTRAPSPTGALSPMAFLVEVICDLPPDPVRKMNCRGL